MKNDPRRNVTAQGTTPNNKRKWRTRWKRIVSTLAAITVFCTTYALILPAITVNSETYCGLEEHEHTEECYTLKLICGFEEGEISDAQADGAEDADAPASADAVSTKTETRIETVTTTEIQSVLVDEGHVHTDDCYEEVTTLTCGQEESEDHTHTDACYETELVLTCGQEEREPVYEDREVEVEKEVEVEVEVPVEEPAQDAPADSVSEAPSAEPHVHTEECYEKVLTCGKEEHKHTDECFANHDADLETAADWERTLPKASELTGNWAQDTLTVAKSQLGYKESGKNFIVVGGERKGYTRYGAMYGVPYGDWCAMFIEFSMHYAGVSTRLMPASHGVASWIRNMQAMDNYYLPGSYTPEPGDIIFFDWDDVRDGDHVGLVAEVKTKEETDASGSKVTVATSVVALEGNSANEVRYNTYKIDDETIMGYSHMPENPGIEELLDFSSMRLIAGTENASVFADEEYVVAENNGVYLLQMPTVEEAARVYREYLDKVDFITPDVAIIVADDETANFDGDDKDVDPAEDIIITETVYTEEENPFAEVQAAIETLEEEVAKPDVVDVVEEEHKDNARVIALIDTGATVDEELNVNSGNIIEAVSLLGEDTADDNGHGDRMVGYMVSQNPDAKIVSIKAIGKDGIGDVSAVIAAIQYAVERDVDIINLSMSAYASEENAALADAVNKAVKAGIVVVGSAGNQGFNAKYYIPGNIEEAVIVGSADVTGKVIAKSNFGKTVDYNVVSSSTSEAAALMSGFISLNGEEGVAPALNQGLIFETGYVAEGDEEVPVVTDGDTDLAVQTVVEEGEESLLFKFPKDNINQASANNEQREELEKRQGDTVLTWDALNKAIQGATGTPDNPEKIVIGDDLAAYKTITISSGKYVKLVSGGYNNLNKPYTIYQDAEPVDGTQEYFNVEGNLTIGDNVVISGQKVVSSINSGSDKPIVLYYPVTPKSGERYEYEEVSGLYSYYDSESSWQSRLYFIDGNGNIQKEIGVSEKYIALIVKDNDREYYYVLDPRKTGTNWIRYTKDELYRDSIADGSVTHKWATIYYRDTRIPVMGSYDGNIKNFLYFNPATGAISVEEQKDSLDASSSQAATSSQEGYARIIVGSTTNGLGSTKWITRDLGVEYSYDSGTYDAPNDFRAITVADNGAVNMEAGEISDFYIQKDKDAPILVKSGVFNMSGGTIKDNTAKLDTESEKFKGVNYETYIKQAKDHNTREIYEKEYTGTESAGAIRVEGGSLKLSGNALIDSNKGASGAIWINGKESEFEMTGGQIKSNNGKVAGAIYVEQGKFNMYGGTIGAKYTENGGNDDGGSNKGVDSVDMTGKQGGNTSIANGTVYIAPKGEMVMESSGNAVPEINSNRAVKGGAVFINSNKVSLISGRMAGNEASYMGGAIYVVGDSLADTRVVTFGKNDEKGKIISKAFIYDNDAKLITGQSGTIGGDGRGGGIWFCNWSTALYDEAKVLIDQNNNTTYYDGNAEYPSGGIDVYKSYGQGTIAEWKSGDSKEDSTWYKNDDPSNPDNQYYIGSTDKPDNDQVSLVNNANGESLNSTNLNPSKNLLIHDNTAPLGGGMGLNGIITFRNLPVYRKVAVGELTIEKQWKDGDRNVINADGKSVDVWVEIKNTKENKIEWTSPTVELKQGNKDPEDFEYIMAQGQYTYSKDGWQAKIALPTYIYDVNKETTDTDVPWGRYTTPYDGISEESQPITAPTEVDKKPVYTGTISSGDYEFIVYEIAKDNSGNPIETNLYTLNLEELHVSEPYPRESTRSDVGDNVIVKTLEFGFSTMLSNVDKEPTADITIAKVDQENHALRGAEFEIRDENDSKLENITVVKSDADGNSATDENATTFTFKDLVAGTYRLAETKIPTDYIGMGDNEYIEFTLERNAKTGALVTSLAAGVNSNNQLTIGGKPVYMTSASETGELTTEPTDFPLYVYTLQKKDSAADPIGRPAKDHKATNGSPVINNLSKDWEYVILCKDDDGNNWFLWGHNQKLYAAYTSHPFYEDGSFRWRASTYEGDSKIYLVSNMPDDVPKKEDKSSQYIVMEDNEVKFSTGTLTDSTTSGTEGGWTLTYDYNGTGPATVNFAAKDSDNGAGQSVDADNNKATSVGKFTINVANPHYGEVEIFKADSDNKPVPGAVLQLYPVNEDKERISGPFRYVLDDTLYENSDICQWITDETGKKRITGLVPGKYILHEASAPEGYGTAPDRVITVNSTDYGDAVTPLTVTDPETGKVIVDKLDASAKYFIGAELEVYDSNDNLIDAWVSDGQSHTIKRSDGRPLAAGWYTIKEKKTPDGFSTFTDEKFEIKSVGGTGSGTAFDKGEKVSVNIQNSSIVSVTITSNGVPHTGYCLSENTKVSGSYTSEAHSIEEIPTNITNRNRIIQNKDKIAKVLYLGYGNDAAGLYGYYESRVKRNSSDGYYYFAGNQLGERNVNPWTPESFRLATQAAVWYYTEGINPYDRKYGQLNEVEQAASLAILRIIEGNKITYYEGNDGESRPNQFDITLKGKIEAKYTWPDWDFNVYYSGDNQPVIDPVPPAGSTTGARVVVNTPKTVDLEVKKEWLEADGVTKTVEPKYAGSPIESVTVKLQQRIARKWNQNSNNYDDVSVPSDGNKDAEGQWKDYGKYEITKDGKWTLKIENLPYADTVAGLPILYEYKLEEVIEEGEEKYELIGDGEKGYTFNFNKNNGVETLTYTFSNKLKTPEYDFVLVKYDVATNVADMISGNNSLDDILKNNNVNENSKKSALAGAKFTLQKDDANGKYYAGYDENKKEAVWESDSSDEGTTLTVRDDGKLDVKGLEPGTYLLTETDAPSGYLLETPNQTWTITINPNGSIGPGAATGKDANKIVIRQRIAGTDGNEDVDAIIGIGNVMASYELPESGGVGTTIMYVLGGILVVGAGVLLIARKRNNR